MADEKNPNASGATPQTDASSANAQLDWSSIQDDIKQFETQRTKKGGKRSAPTSSTTTKKSSTADAPSALSSVPLPVLIGIIVVAAIAIIIFVWTSSGGSTESASTAITPPEMGKSLGSSGAMGSSSLGAGTTSSKGKTGTLTPNSTVQQPGITRPGSPTSVGAGQTGTWTGAGTLAEQERRKLAQQQKNQGTTTRTQNSRSSGFATRTNQVRPKGRANEGFGTDPETSVNDY